MAHWVGQVRNDAIALDRSVMLHKAHACASRHEHEMIFHLKISKFLNLLSHLYIRLNKTVAKCCFLFCQRKFFNIFLWFFNACLHK